MLRVLIKRAYRVLVARRSTTDTHTSRCAEHGRSAERTTVMRQE